MSVGRLIHFSLAGVSVDGLVEDRFDTGRSPPNNEPCQFGRRCPTPGLKPDEGDDSDLADELLVGFEQGVSRACNS